MKKLALAAILSTFTLPAFADATINAKLSTLGFGVEAAFPLAQSVDARIGYNGYRYNFDETSTSNGVPTNYSGDLKLNNAQVLADWHPWEGSFRISAGVIFNNNKFEMTAQPSGSNTINIGGTPYTVGAGETVNATVDFNKTAPYLGIGWGRTPKNSGLSFTSDIGIVFQGKPKGSITTNIPGVSAADINRANTDLNDALDNFRYYPVISIGIGYTF